MHKIDHVYVCDLHPKGDLICMHTGINGDRASLPYFFKHENHIYSHLIT